jgi:hypothetical protein
MSLHARESKDVHPTLISWPLGVRKSSLRIGRNRWAKRPWGSSHFSMGLSPKALTLHCLVLSRQVLNNSLAFDYV